MRHVIKLLEELNAVRRFADPRTFLAYLFQTIKYLPAIVRAGNLSRADTGMRGRACSLRIGERKWMALDGVHFGPAREICCRGVYSAIPGFEVWLVDNHQRVVPFLTGCNGYLFAKATSRGQGTMHEQAERPPVIDARP